MKGQLTFVGLGLYDEEGISLRGKKAVKNADIVFAEFYTCLLSTSNPNQLSTTLEKEVIILDREKTENGEQILREAEKKNVVFLTSGDPMIATTHVDLRMRAHQKGIPTRIIHSGSIVTAAPGLLGIQNYKFGRTTTLAYPQGEYFPTSPYDVIKENFKLGLHTLVLLDIQAEKNRYMTANEALNLLLEMEEKRKENLLSSDSLVAVVARAGSDDALTRADTLGTLRKEDFGGPLHTVVIPGKLNFMELEALELLCGLPKMIAKRYE